MKKIISSVLVLIFAVSSFQVCFAGNAYYGHDWDYPRSVVFPYPGNYPQSVVPQQLVIIPVCPPSNYDKTPNVVVNNNPTANASSQGSKDYSGIANIVKWLAIIGGGTFLYFKYREGIENFLAGLAEPVKETLTSWLEVLRAKQNAEAIGWRAQGYQWLIQGAVSVTAFVLSLFPAVGKAGV